MKQHKGISHCDIPECIFPSNSQSDLQLHKITAHSIWPHNCKLCGLGFESSKNLKMHLKYHKFEQSGVIKCTVGKCNRTFTASVDLKKHMESHSKSSIEPLDYSFLDPQALDDPQRKVNECPLCSKIIKDRGQLQVHVLKHRTETPGVLKCIYKGCGQTFAVVSDLKEHSRHHWDLSKSEERSIVCNVPGCNYATTTKKLLFKHKHVMHSPALWKCFACGKIYKTKSYVMRHIKSVHKKQQSVDNSNPSGQSRDIDKGQHVLVCKDEMEEVVFD